MIPGFYRLSDNRKLLLHKKTELEEAARQLHSMESKWIKNEINIDTYNRWHSQLNQKTIELKNKVAELGREDNENEMLLKNELDKLSDLQSVYLSATIPQKQELIRKGFDKALYYQNNP